MKSLEFIIEEYENLVGKSTSTMIGGVRYPGTVRKVFKHPRLGWRAKAEYSNEPGSFFYKDIKDLTEDGVANQNWFDTLAAALEAEGLSDTWDGITMGGISYGETRRYTYDDGTRQGHFISIYRDDTGRYERPVHYPRGNMKASHSKRTTK